MAEHYRTGRRNHRVIYLQVGSEPSDDDVMVGSLDTAQLARLFVDSVNARVQAPKPLADSPFEDPPGPRCPECHDPWVWHEHGRCAGDFLFCRCTRTAPTAA